jgi:hypothetical protein
VRGISPARGVLVTEQLELVLLVAFVVSVTGLLVTGMVQLALRPAAPPSARTAGGHESVRARANVTDTPVGPLARGVTNDQHTSTRADEPSSAGRRK